MDRLRQIYSILTGSHASLLPDNHLLIRDNRTNHTYHITLTPAANSYSLPASRLAQIKNSQGTSLKMYDPGYKNTLSGESTICYVDALRGHLTYRGYPIAQLASKASYLETTFLLIWGELPSSSQIQVFSKNVASLSIMHVSLNTIIQSFRRDADPMNVLISALYALSTLNPEANPALQGQKIYENITLRNNQICNILGLLPTIVARIYRHQQGLSPTSPNPTMSYVENFLNMLDSKLLHKTSLIKALQILWIVHAEEQSSCSTAMVLHIASSGTDLYTAIAAGTGALSGVKYGGASAAVIQMLQYIGTRQHIPRFLMLVKQRRRLLYGFGHRIFKQNDPRTDIARKLVNQVFRIMDKKPLVNLAIQLQRIVQSDQYFITRKILPNVDFYTALIYHSMDIPSQLFPLLYCIPRASGWLAHWMEFIDDPHSIIVRPAQNYVGHGQREFIEKNERKQSEYQLQSTQSRFRVRRVAASDYKKLTEQ